MTYATISVPRQCGKATLQRWVGQVENGLLVRRSLPLLDTTLPELEPELPTVGYDMGDWEQRQGLWVRPLTFDDWRQKVHTYFAGGYPGGSFIWPSSFHLAMFGYDSPRKLRPEQVDRTRVEPFLGWKTLAIHVTDEGLVLEGAYSRYGIDATARCKNYKTHAVPHWDCSCGFYAYNERPKTPEYGQFIARVEFFGTVIEADRGYRASRQRVLSLEVFRECQSLIDDDCCGQDAAGFQVDRNGVVFPVCAKHAPLGYSSLADLRAELGTEVRWVH